MENLANNVIVNTEETLVENMAINAATVEDTEETLTLSSMEISPVKGIIKSVTPLKKKQFKIAEKIAKLQAEYDDAQAVIDVWEKPAIELYGQKPEVLVAAYEAQEAIRKAEKEATVEAETEVDFGQDCESEVYSEEEVGTACPEVENIKAGNVDTDALNVAEKANKDFEDPFSLEALENEVMNN